MISAFISVAIWKPLIFRNSATEASSIRIWPFIRVVKRAANLAESNGTSVEAQTFMGMAMPMTDMLTL